MTLPEFRVTDPQRWTHRAMGFVTRAHRHLWGKNNEDPLAFLYLEGLSLDFVREMHLGWNKFGQDRPLEGWGLESPNQSSFQLPPGIVLPHIENKTLTAVLIIPMEAGTPWWLPGSHPPPLDLGTVSDASPVFHHPLDGLRAFQREDIPGVRIQFNGPRPADAP